MKQPKANPQFPCLLGSFHHIHAGAIGHITDGTPHMPGSAAMPGLVGCLRAQQRGQLPAALFQQRMRRPTAELLLDVCSKYLQVLQH